VKRVFLDANVLFSAAYTAQNGLLRLWMLSDVELVSSTFAISEALRNLEGNAAQQRLSQLVATIHIVDEPSPGINMPTGVVLPEKDTPILLAAIQSRSTHLLTGDKRHFGALFGQVVDGVLIIRPAEFLATQ
jgi:predicted nucleic acid-binding protein